MNPHFMTLVLGLAAQAESALSGTLPPEVAEQTGGDGRRMAQLLIDTLIMLEQKTEGRLEPDEKKLLSDALTTLRFRFVQTGKPA
jgi:hypothetical protein